MIDLPALTRGPDCASDLQIDEWLGNELSPAERERIASHVDGCARCTKRHLELSEARAAFLEAAPLPRTSRPASRRLFPLGLAGTFAAAAALLLMLRPATTEAPGTRAKGTARTSFYVKRDERVHLGHASEPLRMGDQLRFAYSTPQPAYLAIISRDATGKRSLFYPSARRAERVEPGDQVLLPSSVTLDDAPGDEHVLSLFCDAPLDLTVLLEATTPFTAPPGCVAHELRLTKETRR